MAHTAPPQVAATVTCLHCQTSYTVPLRLRPGPPSPTAFTYLLDVPGDTQALLIVWADTHVGPFHVTR